MTGGRDELYVWSRSRRACAWFLMVVFIGSSNYAIWHLVHAETNDVVKAWAAPFAVDGMFAFSFLIAIGGNRDVTRAVGYATSAAFVVLSMVANYAHAASEGASTVAKVITTAFPFAALMIEVMWRLDVDPAVARREDERAREAKRVEREAVKAERRAAMADRDRRIVKPPPAVPSVSSNGNGNGHKPTPAPAPAPVDVGDVDGLLARTLGSKKHGDWVGGLVRARLAGGESLAVAVHSPALTADVEEEIRRRDNPRDPLRAAQRQLEGLRREVDA